MKTYVIGDIHGQIDHLNVMLDEIKQRTGDEPYELILAGDIMDRGKDSYATYQFIKNLSGKGSPRIVHILGNHDDLYSGSDFGNSQLESSIQVDINGVLNTLKNAFDFYATGRAPLITATDESRMDSASVSIARKAYNRLKNSEKYRILENPKYETLFKQILANEHEFLKSITQEGDEDIKIYKPKNQTAAPPLSATGDNANINFLAAVLHDMKEYFTNLPLIAQRHIGDNSFVITHSGYVPTKDGRIMTDKEIKQNDEIMHQVLWRREVPQERVLSHLICHGHTINESDEHCAIRGADGMLAAVNLDAGAYKILSAIRCVELHTGKLISVSSCTDKSHSRAVVNEYQLKKLAKENEETAVLLSEKNVLLNSVIHAVPDKSDN